VCVCVSHTGSGRMRSGIARMRRVEVVTAVALMVVGLGNGVVGKAASKTTLSVFYTVRLPHG
jgi:hypothetical protein